MLNFQQGLGLGQGEVADRDHMRSNVVELRMAATVAERVELLGVAEVEPCLLSYPRPEPDLEGSVLQGRERPERKPVRGARHVGLPPDDQYDRLILRDGDDRGV